VKRKLSFVLIVVALLLLSVATMPTNAAIQQATTLPTPTAMEQEVVDLTNQLRADLGLQPVCVSLELTLAARRHSQDMADRNYFSHTAEDPAPHGAKFSERARNAGYSGSPRGENIGAGQTSAQSIYNGWEGSSGHYANMTKSDINEIGVGYWQTPGSDYGGHRWTMVTGRGNIDCVKTYTPANVSVGGNLTNAPAEPTITWNHNLSTDIPGMAQAEWYRLMVMQNGNTVMNKWVPVAQYETTPAACSSSSCSHTTEVDWKAGDYKLWIGAWSQSGGLQWTSTVTDFTLATGPNVPALTSPSNGANVSTATFDLVWNQDSRADWYQIILQDPNGKAFLSKWYKDDNPDLCANGSCRVAVQPTKTGTYTWWMRAWSSEGMSIGGYDDTGYARRTFNLNPSRPGAVSGRTPADAGTIAAGTTALSWSADAQASYYRLYLAGPNGLIQNRWYSSLNVCEGSTCTVDGFNLTAGEYSWWMVAWGPAGYNPGGWNDSGWTETTFTVE